MNTMDFKTNSNWDSQRSFGLAPPLTLALILVNYRNIEDTLECLRSLEKARGIWNLRVLVVENASGDDSLEELKKYAARSNLSLKILAEKQNLGFGAGCNAGLKVAFEEKHSHAILLNNDTLVGSDFILKAQELVSRHPETVLTGRVVNHFNDQNTWGVGKIDFRRLRVIHFLGDESLLQKAGPVDFASGCLLLIPKIAIQKCGPFDEAYFMYVEDLDFCIRLRQGGFRILYFPDWVIRHKVGASSRKSSLQGEYYDVRNHGYLTMKHGRILEKTKWIFKSILMLLKCGIFTPPHFRLRATAVVDAMRKKMGPSQIRK